MKTDKQIAEQCRKHKAISLRGLSSQKANIAKCNAFEAADYMDYTDKIQFTDQNGKKKRARVQIPRIRPFVDGIVGSFVQNRKKPKYSARVRNVMLQESASKYVNFTSEYLRKNMNADQVETQQDYDLIRTGIGAIETAMTYGEGRATRGTNGEPEMMNLDLANYWWDPKSRQTGLLDRRWDGYDEQRDLDEAKSLFTNSDDEDFEADGPSGSDGDYEYQDGMGSYDRIKYDWADKKENLVNITFYQWYDIEKYYKAVNPVLSMQNPEAQARSMMEMETIKSEVPDDEDFDPRAEEICFGKEVHAKLMKVFAGFLEPIDFNRKVFYTAVLSGDKVFKKYRNKYQDGFTRTVKTGKYDHKNNIWVGVVNSMMEPQKYYDKLLTETMFIIAANSKGGVIVERSAIEDVDEFSDQYAKTDSVCVVEDGAISGGKIQDKRTGYQMTGYEQIITLMDKSFNDVTGVDPTFLGDSANKLETALLHRQRVRRTFAVLATYADTVSLYQTEHARLMLDMMREYAQNNRGALIPILGEGGAQEFFDLSEDKLMFEYGVELSEAPVTPEEREEMAKTLTAMGDKYLSAMQFPKADACYALAAKYMNIDPDDLQQLTNVISGGPAPDPAYVKQLEEENATLKNQITQSQVNNTNADTQKKTMEAAKIEAQIPEVRASVHQKAADTTKKLEESQKTEVETEILKRTGGKPQQGQGAQAQ